MKYMGSKARIAKHIVPILQKCIDDNVTTSFIDLFCGGCNIIDKINHKRKYANDINKYLIALLDWVANEYLLPDEAPFETYSKIRANKDKYSDYQVGIYGFLASYNGRFFDGGYAKSGYENGKLRNYYREARDNLLKQAPNLKGIIFTIKDYIEYENTQNAVIYCDPPYSNTKTYANATKFDSDKFWNFCRKASFDNYVFISEQNAPEDFICIWEQPTLRSIKAKDKSYSVEKLFVYKYGKLGGYNET